MLETPFPFFICKTLVEIPIFGTFFREKIDFFSFLSILVYVHWKSTFWVRPCLKTSLWRHTLTDFHDFGINGKKRPYPWYQTIIIWARQFQVHKGVVTTPLVNHVTKKCLEGRGLILITCVCIIESHLFRNILSDCNTFIMINIGNQFN